MLWSLQEWPPCFCRLVPGLSTWVVESGVDAGLGKGTAGLMLSIGAALGIAIRVGWGMRLDRMSWHPFVIAGVMVFGGAIGAIGLTGRSATIHIIATVVAFSGAGFGRSF